MTNGLTTRPRAVVQIELVQARLDLREAEAARDRAVKVADRWDGHVGWLWAAVWTGLATLALGFLAVYVDNVTGLSLGGVITAHFTVGGLMLIGGALGIPAANATDSLYRKSTVGRYGDVVVSQTRRELADALTDNAERELNRVTELTVELADAEATEETP